MKKILLFTILLFSRAGIAGGSGGGGVNGTSGLIHPVNFVMDTGDQYVWLNSLDDYDGPGKLVDCHKALTYAGTGGASGPAKGTQRLVYICRVKR